LDEDETLSVPAPGVLANDSDGDGDRLTAVLQNQPSNGTITLLEDGSFTYTPAAKFSGLDGFTYSASDGIASSVAAFSLMVRSINDGPDANDDAYSVAANTTLEIEAPGVLENDSDADGDRLTADVIDQPLQGVLVFNANGAFSYTPSASFVGEDSFTYVADDGEQQSGLATVRISVTSVGRPPIAADDFFAIGVDSVLVIPAPGVLGNDADGDQDMLTAILTEDANEGTLAFMEDGSFSFTPPPGFTGVVRFRYRATDGSNVSNEAQVQINIQ
jgi:hypothetical protein